MLFNNFTCLNSIKLNHYVFENKSRYNIENKSLLVQFLSNLYEIHNTFMRHLDGTILKIKINTKVDIQIYCLSYKQLEFI